MNHIGRVKNEENAADIQYLDTTDNKEKKNCLHLFFGDIK